MDRPLLYLGVLCSFVRALVEKDYEVVGYVLGKRSDNLVDAYTIVMARNIAKRPRSEFVSHPLDIIIADKVSELYGLDVVGNLHSHPRGDCKPSQTDLRNMRVWNFVWIIVSEGCIGAYELRNEDLVDYEVVCDP